MSDALPDLDPREGRANGRRLLFAQFVSATGDALFIPCIGWLAAGTGDRGFSVGLAVFVATAPHLLFGPLAGALADRLDRRRLMIASDVLRFLLLASLATLGLVQGSVPFPVLVGAAFLLSAFSTPFMASRDALLPRLVPRGELSRWNAWMQTSNHLAIIVGLALGGALLFLLGSDPDSGIDDTRAVMWVLAFDAVTFLVSGVALVRISGARRKATEAPAPSRFLTDVKAGLGYAAKDDVVRGLLVLTALNNFAIMGPAYVGAVLLVKQVYAMGAFGLAWFEGVMAVGIVLGALFLVRYADGWSMGRVLLLGMVMDGLTYIPFLWIPGYPLGLAMVLVHGFFIPFIVVARTNIAQQHVPDAQRGRVFALINLTVMGMTAVSALTCGFLVEWLGPRALFGLAGVFGALSGLYGMLWVGARLRPFRSSASASDD